MKLTGRAFAPSGITEDNLIHIVITGDTSQSPLGSSYKATLGEVKDLFGDIYVTGLTFNVSNYDLSVGRNDGASFTQNLSILSSDVTITGGTYNPSTGDATFTNNTGGTFTVTGFLTGFTDTYVTGGTYSNGNATFTNNTGGTFNVTGFTTPFTGGSDNCITDFYVTNIYGCSPITIHNQIQSTGSTASGLLSYAFGDDNIASGDYSHAEGYKSLASGNSSHAEGGYSVSNISGGTASGPGSHAEGRGTLASGNFSHAEGYNTIASGNYSHTEGVNTIASGTYSHAEGGTTKSSGFYSHAEGRGTIASGDNSHSGGHGYNGSTDSVVASGNTSFVHYKQTSASGLIGAYGDYSSILGGSDHNISINSTSSAIFGGSGNTISSSVFSVINGGKINDIGVSNYSGIFVGSGNTIGTGESPGFDIDAYRDVIIGGNGHTIYQGTDSSVIVGGNNNEIHKYTNNGVIIGGSQNDINQTTNNSVIVGGTGNTINDGVDRSVILGGKNLTATLDDYTYSPNMIINTGGTGSRLGINTTPTHVIHAVGGKSSFYFEDSYTSGYFDNFRQMLFVGDSDTAPAYVITDGSVDIGIGVRGISTTDTTAMTGLGIAGDTFINASAAANGLNIMNYAGTGTEDYIRFYAGQYPYSANTADIHIQGSGATRGYVGINNELPTERLDVDGNARFRSIGSSASSGALHYTADGTLTTNTSDIRLKTNILPLQNSLEKVKNLRGVSYNWIEDGTSRIGFIAQEVNEVVPELTFINENSSEKYMGVHYDNVTALLVEAIKDMSKTIDELKEEIRILKNK